MSFKSLRKRWHDDAICFVTVNALHIHKIKTDSNQCLDQGCRAVMTDKQKHHLQQSSDLTSLFYIALLGLSNPLSISMPTVRSACFILSSTSTCIISIFLLVLSRPAGSWQDAYCRRRTRCMHHAIDFSCLLSSWLGNAFCSLANSNKQAINNLAMDGSVASVGCVWDVRSKVYFFKYHAHPQNTTVKDLPLQRSATDQLLDTWKRKLDCQDSAPVPVIVAIASIVCLWFGTTALTSKSDERNFTKKGRSSLNTCIGSRLEDSRTRLNRSQSIAWLADLLGCAQRQRELRFQVCATLSMEKEIKFRR